MYLTTLKDDLFQCPNAKCTYVSSLDLVKSHLKGHDFYRVSKVLLNEIKAEGIAVPPSLRISFMEPTPYKHKAWMASSCEFCGEEFGENRPKLNNHRKTCPSRPRFSFPCMYPGCDFKAPSNEHLEKHRRMHAGDDSRAARKAKHTCGYCKQSFDHHGSFQRHVDTCKKNPNKVKLFMCPQCQKEFGRKDHLTRHLRNHQCAKGPSKL